MSDTAKTVAEVMKPFALRYTLTAEMHWKDAPEGDDGVLLSITGLDHAPVAGDAIWDTLLDDARKLHEGEFFVNTRASDVAWRPPAESENNYPQRVAKMVASMAEAFPESRSSYLSTPYFGWLALYEAAVEGLIARTKLEPDARFRILQIKEKFGELRFYVSAKGSEAYVRDINAIARWAELASEGRCIATGAPGARQTDGWVLTLSPAMAELRRTEPDKLRAIMLPIQQA